MQDFKTKLQELSQQKTKKQQAEEIKQAKKDKNIVAITAAMPSGTGLDIFQKAYL